MIRMVRVLHFPITVEVMHELCNRYQWFTAGTCRQYSKLFDMVRAGFSNEQLAAVITLCSDGENARYKFILDELYAATIYYSD